MTTNRPPLAGIRILDFSALLPGAVCTTYLADLGADVIKIEAPGTGDSARGPAGSPLGPFFSMTNRNKRSVVLNLKDAEDVATALRMVADADVIVEGYRPGVMKRLGLSYEAAKEVRPEIVYCSITGYGQTGPLADKGGHDINYQSYAGILEQNVIDGSRPSPGNFPITDLSGGLTAALGIIASVLDVKRGGPGRYIDASLTDCAMMLNIPALASRQLLGSGPPPGHDTLSGSLPCYRTYRTADGHFVAIGALEPKFWMNFCNAVKRPDLIRSGWESGEGFDRAIEEVAAVVASKTYAEWSEFLAGLDACVTPVLTLEEALSHPNTVARRMVLQSGKGQQFTHYAFPLKMTDYEFAITQTTPELGEHNDEVLAPYLQRADETTN